MLLVVTALALVSCSPDEPISVTNQPIAVLLPDGAANNRWISDKANMEKAFKQVNASKVTYYSAPESTQGATTQANQLKEAYHNGTRNFIITAIDQATLNEAMKEMTNIRIVCHDRLIKSNTNIGAYSSCDAREIGRLQGQYLIMAFDLSGKEVMNLEMLAGPASDENSEAFFDGAYDVLKTYINNGTLNIVSGKYSFHQVALPEWTAEAAKAEMKERLKKYDSATKVDLVLAPNDMTAEGAIAAFDEAQYSLKEFPFITGQDNLESAKQYIEQGKQYMTVDKSLIDMAYNSVSALVNLINGGIPTSDSWIDNGSVRIPFLKSTPVAIYKN